MFKFNSKIISPQSLGFENSPFFQKAYLGFQYIEMRIPGVGIGGNGLVSGLSPHNNCLVFTLNIGRNRQTGWFGIPFDMSSLSFELRDPFSNLGFAFADHWVLPGFKRPTLFGSDPYNGIQTRKLTCLVQDQDGILQLKITYRDLSLNLRFKDLSGTHHPQIETRLEEQPYQLGQYYKHKRWLELDTSNSSISLGRSKLMNLSKTQDITAFEDVWTGFPPAKNNWDWVLFTGKTKRGKDVRIILGKNSLRAGATAEESGVEIHIWMGGKYTTLTGNLIIDYEKNLDLIQQKNWEIVFYSDENSDYVIMLPSLARHTQKRSIHENKLGIHFDLDWVGLFTESMVRMKINNKVIEAWGYANLESNRQMDRSVGSP